MGKTGIGILLNSSTSVAAVATTEIHFDLGIPRSQRARLKAVPHPFIDHVRGRSAKTISAEEGRASTEMVIGAYRSMAEGRRIPLG